MNIVYYTSNRSGFGRILIGISIGNALKRKGIKATFTIISYPVKAGVVRDYKHIQVPFENDVELSEDRYHKSAIYKRLRKLKPDVLLINHLWFTLGSFIDELDCKKIYLSDHAEDRFFTLYLSRRDITLTFNRDQFDRVIAIEPFKSSVEMEQINPLIQKNRGEILEREEALDILNRDGNTRLALYGLDGHPYDSGAIREKYSYLTEKGYDMIYPSNYGDIIYPYADYYNALDFLVYGGGYNQVWEAVYFEKDAAFEPVKLRQSDQADRVKQAEHFRFTENGADQLVDIIMKM